MGFPDTACVAFRLSQAVYRPLFEEVWGKGSFAISFPPNTAEICATPGGAAVFGGSDTPIALSPGDRTHANTVYDHWGQSIDAYEQSVQVSAFSSKFDAFLAGKYTFTANEMAGYKLFDGKGNCNSCHLDARSTTLTPDQTDTRNQPGGAPVFSFIGSAYEGLPLNPRDAFYYQTTPDSFGFTGNPLGFGYRDLGMGTFLSSGFGSAPNPNVSWRKFSPRDVRVGGGTETASEEGPHAQVSIAEAERIAGEPEGIRRGLIIEGIPGIQGETLIGRSDEREH